MHCPVPQQQWVIKTSGGYILQSARWARARLKPHAACKRSTSHTLSERAYTWQPRAATPCSTLNSMHHNYDNSGVIMGMISWLFDMLCGVYTVTLGNVANTMNGGIHPGVACNIEEQKVDPELFSAIYQWAPALSGPFPRQTRPRSRATNA